VGENLQYFEVLASDYRGSNGLKFAQFDFTVDLSSPESAQGECY
jgi:hypothetical protein